MGTSYHKKGSNIFIIRYDKKEGEYDMSYASSAFNEKPEIDQSVGMQVYLHEGGVWVQGHWHEALEVVYAISGIVSLEVNNQIIHLNKGESLVIKPGEVHGFIASPKSVRLVVQFTLDALSKSIYRKMSIVEVEEKIVPIDLRSHVWPKKLSRKFHHLLFEIQEAFGEHDALRDVRLLNLASECMMIFLNDALPKNEKLQKRKASQRLNKLKDIYDYIENNYQKNLTLDKIASHVGYNKHYLTRFFKSMTGHSVIGFLTDYRLNQAKWLLITSDDGMDEIAFKAGFQSTKRFHHVFKETMNISPLQYRKEMMQNKGV